MNSSLMESMENRALFSADAGIAAVTDSIVVMDAIMVSEPTQIAQAQPTDAPSPSCIIPAVPPTHTKFDAFQTVRPLVVRFDVTHTTFTSRG